MAVLQPADMRPGFTARHAGHGVVAADVPLRAVDVLQPLGERCDTQRVCVRMHGKIQRNFQATG